MLTFTGERVIPGMVEPDLWNEHVARYYFARQFAVHRRVLDIGCGAGYGVNLLSATGELCIGVDLSPEAVAYAIEHAAIGTSFCVASAEDIPFPNASFDLITAFEIIEHLSDWKALVSEAARLLTADGVFFVSTPNKAYYAETRQEVGTNPFHIHEFELAEYQELLQKHFSEVTIFAQNHQEVIAFIGAASPNLLSGYRSASSPLHDAHFFLAVCSQKPLATSSFLYAASGGNLLKERETHIRLLKEEVEALKQLIQSLQKNERLLQSSLQEHIDRLTHELKESREHANQLQEIIGQLTDQKNSLTEQYDQKTQDLAATRTILADTAEERDTLSAERALVAQSRWIALGRRLGFGPRL